MFSFSTEVNISIIVGAVVFLAVLWSVVAVRHLKSLKKQVYEQWELIDEQLRKRQSVLPNLIETVRIFAKDKEELLEKMIVARMKAAKEYSRGVEKIEYEHDLSMVINEVVALEKENADLAKDTNFLELKTEIGELGNDLEEEVKRYNEMVRYYNGHRNMAVLRPIASVYKFGILNIFEVES
ncbi:LemA family protein [Candidatus Peregrinibacteria bacterium]|nr:LemA family protein [Candidatus Peregrinibacteria bacterium]